MNRENRVLVMVLAVLAVSVLVTGTLAVYLTVARRGERGAVVADPVSGGPRIAFVSDRDGDVAVYVMAADGSGLERLSGIDQGFCFDPSWSPDGQRVAYWVVEGDSLEEEDVASAIWVSTADGSEHIRVAPSISGAFLTRPAWSPDGTRLAFPAAGESDGEEVSNSVISVVWSDGSNVERSFSAPGMVRSLAWSPVGDDLLLVSEAANDGASVYVWSGEREEVIEVAPDGTAADWSPDGNEIVVADTAAQEVLVVGQDWESRTVARVPGRFPVDVVWSPDGGRIAVGISLALQRTYATSLYIVTLATGETVHVVEDEGWIIEPEWSPDGNRLLFTMGEYRRRPDADMPYAYLWVYALESGQLEQLTVDELFSGIGVWSP